MTSKLWPYKPPDAGHEREYDNDQEGLATLGVGLYPEQRQQARNEAQTSEQPELHEHGYNNHVLDRVNFITQAHVAQAYIRALG
jgi:hypothetical protein